MAEQHEGAFPSSFQSGVLSSTISVAGGPVDVVFGLRHNGVAFTLADGEKRHELLDSIAGGETVELSMDFRGFQQQEGVPNRNFLKFAKKLLRPLAKSFAGVPLLRDHNDRQLEARAGTLTKSKAVPIDGGVAFDMTADVTAPFAVEALLRGNLDRFSIGWLHGGFESILCSLCRKPIFSECSHLPGDKVVNEKSGKEDVIEFEFTEAEGIEVSAVTVPAVKGTGIQDVRAALSFAAAKFEADTLEEDNQMDHKQIAKALNLPEGSDEKTILAALAARDEANAANANRVQELNESNAQLATDVASLQERDRAREFDGLFSTYADRLPVERNEAGVRVKSALETKLRGIKDAGAVEAILQSLPKLTPEGNLQSLSNTDRATASPERDERIPAGAQWNGDIATALEQLGVSVEDYAEFGPHRGPPKIKFYNGVKLNTSRH